MMKVLSESMADGYRMELLEDGAKRFTGPDGEVSTWPAPDPVLAQWVVDNIDPRIDLTKPIYEQASRLWQLDEDEERLRNQRQESSAA